uniref:Uncharacterized protein n=1 Tax=Ditylenchus dipsaci TaxID=166011 RepID=A0A915ESH5_9BILA
MKFLFNLEVAVSDGANEARAYVKLYKLQPGTNIVIVESERSVDKIDKLQIVRQLSVALDQDVRVLVKQVYIEEDGHPNTVKSHLLLYALDQLSKRPVEAVTLRSILDAQLPKMKQLASAGNEPGAEMILHLCDHSSNWLTRGCVAVPQATAAVFVQQLDPLLLMVIAGLVCAVILILLFWISCYCCKKRNQ